MNITRPISDTGSLRRGVVILKLLATAGARGMALTELAAKAGVPHPTVHRVLAQLLSENLAQHNVESRRYRLGPLAFELGIAGSSMYDIRELCRPQMTELARLTGDTVYLVMRSGLEAVCMHRCEGAAAIRVLVLQNGSRRPLGVGAGGLAILSAMPEIEREEIIGRLSPSLSTFGQLNADALHNACEEAASDHAAVIHNRVTLGISAVGVPFRNSFDQVVGALTVASLSDRMKGNRIKHAAEFLSKAAKAIELQLANTRISPELAVW